ncbi:Trp biosynthesis-associated membrane protein [Actinocorallia longicatena]|uniref:TIGR02234 family membrane protein n=1 Tax=Actinocorallia longicatena TaxID=111803 RepID=A0ABP6QK14_9ACTN
MTPRRELTAVAATAAAGSLLAVYAAGRVWATAASGAVGTAAQKVEGSGLTPGRALGWAALAAVFAVFATRGRARIPVGALMVLLGAGIAGSAVLSHGRSDVLSAVRNSSVLLSAQPDLAISVNAWWSVSLVGGLLVAAAGLATVVRGRAWPGMSARYDRKPAEAAPAAADDPASLWKSLDRGEDPTSTGAGPHDPGTLPDGPQLRAAPGRER